MNVLVIGGTRFVGRHLVDALQARGHSVTLFNRGVSDASAFPKVEQIHGDRERDLQLLDGRTWDALVDTCGYMPDSVDLSARYFAGRTGRYLFVSTISVYDFASASGDCVDEDSSLQSMPAEADATKVTPESYGPLKVLCEARVRAVYGERASIVRPGLVAGPYDPTDRFTYWPVRVDAGGTVLLPEQPAHPVRYIDARDLAEFMVRMLETDDAGTYNAVTPPGSVTFGDLFEASASVSGSGAAAQWVNAGFLKSKSVEEWSDLPLWVSSASDMGALLRVSPARALARGLSVRPAPETVRDTLSWARRAGKRFGALSAGLSPEREEQLLREYRERLTAAVE